MIFYRDYLIFQGVIVFLLYFIALFIFCVSGYFTDTQTVTTLTFRTSVSLPVEA